MHHPQHPQTAQPVIDLHDQVKAAIEKAFPQTLLSSSIDYDFPVFVINKPQIHDVLSFLKTEKELAFSFLTTMCGIHFPEHENHEFAIMYQLHNMITNKRIRLKVFMSRKDMIMPTATDLWAAANWMEREAYDFYGFIFKGHPDLRRILNMEEMNYHPLRKEYALEDAGRNDKADKYFGR
jgi:NADH-quinone oxidoreductase subunit C